MLFKRVYKTTRSLVMNKTIKCYLIFSAVTPIITSIATKRGLFCRRPMMVVPFQLFLVGLCVTFATPLCCAIFDQRASISVDSLDPGLRVRCFQVHAVLCVLQVMQSLVLRDFVSRASPNLKNTACLYGGNQGRIFLVTGKIK